MTLAASHIQWSITIHVLTCDTAPLFTNKVPHDVQMTLTTSHMQWSITILVLTCCTTPLFTNKVPHNTHMTSHMQWSITVPVPSFWITVVLLHQPPGHIQPAMVARVVEESLLPVVSNICRVPNLR